MQVILYLPEGGAGLKFSYLFSESSNTWFAASGDLPGKAGITKYGNQATGHLAWEISTADHSDARGKEQLTSK
jgi:hypothetical protein